MSRRSRTPTTFQLETKHARAVAKGHPWVYRQALGRSRAKVRRGAVVELVGPDRRFLGRGLFDPGSGIAVRVWTRTREQPLDGTLIAHRLAAAAERRTRFGVDRRATTYRLANAEGDGLPGLLVDRFGDHLSVEIQTEALRAWRAELAAAVQAVFPGRGAVLRDGERTTHLCGPEVPEECQVVEPTARLVALVGAQGKPGVFMDMREVRVRLAQLVPGRSFLNLFAHTGAFSACAARAGASEVVSVDLSGRYLDVAARNVEASAPGFDAHVCYAEDVFRTLAEFSREERRFDVVLADPPSFSTSRKGGSFQADKRYPELVKAALRVLAPGGVLIAATNHRGTTREQFLKRLQDGAHAERRVLRVHEFHGQPADYPVPPVLPEFAHLLVAVCQADEPT